MAGKKTKFYLALLVILGVMGGLIYFSMSGNAVFFLKPSELISKAKSDSTVHNDRVRIGGIVVNEKIKGDNVDRVWKFHITDERGDVNKNLVMVSLSQAKKDKTIKIAYTGVVPDTFKIGGMAIVEGKYGKDGVFRADTLLAKCPSKYEGVKRPDQLKNKKSKASSSY